MLIKSEIKLTLSDNVPKNVADIFVKEWKSRFGFDSEMPSSEKDGFNFVFKIKDKCESESYSVSEDKNGITVTAHRLRGLIYGMGRIFRNLTVKNGKSEILDDAFGEFAPDMPVRGHGIGYTDMSNSYEAWNENQFYRYILDLMFFGLNTVETSYSAGNKKTDLMKYDFRDAYIIISRICEELDVDLTVWYFLSKSKTDDETVEDMMNVYGGLPKITSLFIPGGDPGDLLPEDFIRRCGKIKQAFSVKFPSIKLFPSAQAPHEYPDWRERFTKVMNENPEDVDGIIFAPNHAMSLDDLRRTINKKYPLHHYPDISHNVRCETPVHFIRNDWHFAWSSTLSRECVNPRPSEYRLLHRLVRQYFEGQVSYSEGIHDDINKIVWSSLDFDFSADLTDILKEYARVFFFGMDENRLVSGIFGLEQSWSCDPIESVGVEPTYKLFKELIKENPKQNGNWRFDLLLFRATCDKIVRDRRIFELDLLKKAKKEIINNRISNAKVILETDFDENYKILRKSLFSMAEKLFDEIGIQLDVEHFKGMSWERGCTLDTIDMPITDRRYMLKKINSGISRENLLRLFNRRNVEKDEYYFSFAFDGFDVCGMQDGEFYMDFTGDRNGDGEIPMCMVSNYDHFNFKTNVAGLTGGDYFLRITYKDRNHNGIEHHRLYINGNEIFNGKGFGGVRDYDYEALFLPKGYQSVVYYVPENLIVNGCAVLEIYEDTVGFVISEYSFIKKQSLSQ